MTLSIADDVITSDVTPHTATRTTTPVPGERGWAVSWLPNRVLDYAATISAMMIADLASSIAEDEIHGRTVAQDDERRLQINDLAHELGISGAEAERLARRSPVQYADAEAHDAEDREVCADETCGECASERALLSDRSLYYEGFEALNPRLGEIFADADGRQFFTLDLGGKLFLIDMRFVYDEWRNVIDQVGPLTRVYPAAEPAKTHDLSIQFRNGNAVITVGNEPGGHQVYLPIGVAEDLGRALSSLTPTQRQLLVDVLTGGEK